METTPETDELVIVREFDAPRALVYACWTEPERMAEWFMPADMTVPQSEADIREGGRYRTCLRAADGTEHWVRGEYRELRPPARIAFTHGWDNACGEVAHWSLCEIDLAEAGGRTRMTFRQSPFVSAASREGHREGWRETFDNLATYLGRA